jgi:predicted nucleic acid-binding protein
MTIIKNIVLDANILIRGVLGTRVVQLLEKYHNRIGFFTATVCFEDAQKYLPLIIERQGRSHSEQIIEALEALSLIIEPLDESVYSIFREEAQQRISARDPDDWPLVALSLFLQCPIWTEDTDFFGTGVAVWNTQNVELYLRS